MKTSEFNRTKTTPAEDVISDEELFHRIRGDYQPKPSALPFYGTVDLAKLACEGYGADRPILENPPKWGIRMWSSVRRDPPSDGLSD